VFPQRSSGLARATVLTFGSFSPNPCPHPTRGSSGHLVTETMERCPGFESYDRFFPAGNLQDIARIVRARDAALKATEQPIDTSTAAGKCFLDMLGVFAEFENNLRRARARGHGLENLYQTIIALDEIDLPLRNAAEITNAALWGTCATSRATVDMFCGMLGGFAGSVGLAHGGVYIAGGIAPAFSITRPPRSSGDASSRRVDLKVPRHQAPGP